MAFLPYILLVMVPGLVLSVWASYRVRSTFGKWDKVDSGISMNAFDFARYLLNGQGLNQVTVEPTPGTLTDHYDRARARCASRPGWRTRPVGRR